MDVGTARRLHPARTSLWRVHHADPQRLAGAGRGPWWPAATLGRPHRARACGGAAAAWARSGTARSGRMACHGGTILSDGAADRHGAACPVAAYAVGEPDGAGRSFGTEGSVRAGRNAGTRACRQRGAVRSTRTRRSGATAGADAVRFTGTVQSGGTAPQGGTAVCDGTAAVPGGVAPSRGAVAQRRPTDGTARRSPADVPRLVDAPRAPGVRRPAGPRAAGLPLPASVRRSRPRGR